MLSGGGPLRRVGDDERSAPHDLLLPPPFEGAPLRRAPGCHEPDGGVALFPLFRRGSIEAQTPVIGDTASLSGTDRLGNNTPAASTVLLCWVSSVYVIGVSRINDLDGQAGAAVMRRYESAAKRDVVTSAQQAVAGEPLDLGEARSLRGSGWYGDLDQMRTTRLRDPHRHLRLG